MPNVERGRFLTVAAILFAVLAISNLLKPLQIGGERTGFVFLGERLSGTPNTIAGPIFGAFLAVYAAGIWGMRRWALPMGALYAAYVIVNLVLFPFRTPPPANGGVGYQIFGIVYMIVAIGISAGAYRALAKRRADLR